jgi:hypothetical protein
MNGEGADPTVALAAIDLFLDLPSSPPLNRHTPPSTWRDYEGTYVDPPGGLGRFAITAREDGLSFELLGGQRLLPGDLDGVFWREPDGHVSYFVTRWGVARRL